MTLELFEQEQPIATSAALSQYFTPLWVAEALVARHFPTLSAGDLVLEPSCGVGAFLKAIPAHVPAIGVEIDTVIAARARAETARPVLTGDFLTVELEHRPNTIIGNPPFVADLIELFLERCHDLLPLNGRAGFILPAYIFQTSERVCRYAERWSITQEFIPRNAFHAEMKTPLCFAMFSKETQRILVGFGLYQETADKNGMAKEYREILSATHGPTWLTVCRTALERLGGTADLKAIYGELERNRPSTTQFWKEKIRQTLRVYGDVFRPLEQGRYTWA